MQLEPATDIPVRLSVNGEKRELTVEARRSLADVLRRELGLTGTRVGCETGVCGTCTVLADGDPIRSCLTLAASADGTSVETVESLAAGGRLSALQKALADHFGLQCGFCTPGFLMLATALVRAGGPPDRERIREHLAANLCRCTGYTPIVDAVESVLRDAA
ncbi:(2Fe-2S)-binding protein [Actinoplanes sp. NPDC049596]|uniref:(2Fe-2S)-binding protein n=1 Tax=unclassified Actinoplanes TaxID=2626549 RepID=UPI003439D198